MTTETTQEAGLRRQLDHLADLMPGAPSRLRSVQRRVRRRRQRRAAGVLTVVAGATVATGALSFRSRPATVASLAAATKTTDPTATATTAPAATDPTACAAIATGAGTGTDKDTEKGTGTGGEARTGAGGDDAGAGKPIVEGGQHDAGTPERLVKGIGTVTAVDGDRLTVDVTTQAGTAKGMSTSSSGEMTEPSAETSISTGESPLPAVVEAVRTGSTLLLDHGNPVTTLETPVGSTVVFAGPVAADGSVTLAQLEITPDDPGQPPAAGVDGADSLVKGRGTIVAIDGATVQVQVDDGPLGGQTLTLQGPPIDPSCGPATVGASVGFEAESTDGGATYRLLLLSN